MKKWRSFARQRRRGGPGEFAGAGAGRPGGARGRWHARVPRGALRGARRPEVRERSAVPVWSSPTSSSKDFRAGSIC